MDSLKNLDPIVDEIRTRFEEVDGVREKAYKLSREVTRMCANTIRAVHRSEWDDVEQMLAKTRRAVEDLISSTRPLPQIYYAGYTQDCLKEYVEAECTYALVQDLPLKTPSELDVEASTYINGLAEAATELRRRILDIIRHNHTEEAERLLGIMDDVYTQLTTLDFRDAITGGLRRRTDTVRAVLERTRGDVTTSLRQAQLEEALENLEEKLTMNNEQ